MLTSNRHFLAQLSIAVGLLAIGLPHCGGTDSASGVRSGSGGSASDPGQGGQRTATDNSASGNAAGIATAGTSGTNEQAAVAGASGAGTQGATAGASGTGGLPVIGGMAGTDRQAGAAGVPDAAQCGQPLTQPPTEIRPSSFRSGSCDFGEVADYTRFDLLCPPGVDCAGTQTGDGRCHRVCDDAKCASGEHCEPRPMYVSDTPSRYANLCLCSDATCPERGPAALPWPEEGGLANWRGEPSMPVDLYYHAAAANRDQLFVSGGLKIRELSGSSGQMDRVDAIYRASLDAEGALAAWTVAGTMPQTLIQHAMTVVGNRLYLSGGQSVTGAALAQVFSYQLNGDGSLSDYREEIPLPAGRIEHTMLHAEGVLIVAAGSLSASYSTQGTTTIWLGRLDQEARITGWSTVQAPVPIFYDAPVAAGAQRLYVLGSDRTIYSASLPSLGAFRKEASPAFLPDYQYGSSDLKSPQRLVALCGALIVLGPAAIPVTAPLDPSGQLGLWRIATRPYGIANSGYAVAANADTGYLYVLGGSLGVELGRAVWSTHRL